jgi:hypothetical protein
LAIASSTAFRKQSSGLEGLGPRTGLTDGSLLERFRPGAADEAGAAFAAWVDCHAPRVPRVLAQPTDLGTASSRFLHEAFPDGRRTGGVLGEKKDLRSGQVRLPNRARAQIKEIGGRIASIVRRAAAAGREWRDPASPAAGPGPVALHGPEYHSHERRGWPMEYVLWLMLVGFSLAGAVHILAGVRGLWTTLRRRPYLRSAVGTIVAIQVGPAISDPDSDAPSTASFPILRFRTESGEAKKFRSALGQVGRSPAWRIGTKPGITMHFSRASADRLKRSPKYRIGMTLPVLYDPDEVLPPTIHSWAALWGGYLACLLSGAIFFGGAAMVYVAFGDRLFGGA